MGRRFLSTTCLKNVNQSFNNTRMMSGGFIVEQKEDGSQDSGRIEPDGMPSPDNNLIRAIFDNTAALIVVLDHEGRIVRFNPAAERFSGYRFVDVESRCPWDIFVQPADAAEYRRLILEQLAGDTLQMHYINCWRNRSGGNHFIEWSNSVLKGNDGKAEYLVAVGTDATERKIIEDARREVEERFWTLFENAPEAIAVLDTDKQRFIDANQNACLLFKLDREELLQYGPVDLSPPLQPDGRESAQKAAEMIQQALAGTVQRFEWTHRDVRGGDIDCEVYLVRLPSASHRILRCSIVDISLRKQTEVALRASEKKYRQLFENMTSGFALHEIICDGNGKPVDYRYLEVNPAFEKLTGISADAILGKTVREVLPNIEDYWIETYGKVALTGEPLAYENYSRELDRTYDVWAFSPEKNQFAVVFTDISERKQAEKQRQDLERQVQHSQKLESLGVLAGGIAHDFNNLLTGILGFSDLALKSLDKQSPAADCIYQVVTGAKKAAELTQQMLAYSGKGRFNVHPEDLNELLQDIRSLLEISISKKCKLEYHLASGLPAFEADPAQIRQIIMNLVINASEAIGDRNGTITISTGAMYCDRAYLKKNYMDHDLLDGRYIFFEVSDTGHGIPKETLKKIFDPFFTTKFTGRGLGLAAVLGIIRGHGGTIRVYSEPGHGTSFKILFPVSKQAVVAQPDDGYIAEDTWQGEGKVLVIDDEASVRSLAGAMLRTMGFDVLTASDGEEGVEAFRRYGEEIGIVLLDLTMPKMDGEETLNAIRAIRQDARIILSSGYNQQAAIARFSGQSLSGFIQKPYCYEDLVAVVRRVMQE